MLHEIGREPTPEELAEKLAMPLEKVRKVLKIAKEPISLETPIGDEEDSHLGDFIEDKNAILPIDAAIQSNLRETTTRVLASLTPREERVLRMRFGIGMNTDHTLEEVGQQFSVTRERIRQIEAKALRKLKHPSRGRASCEASWIIKRGPHDGQTRCKNNRPLPTSPRVASLAGEGPRWRLTDVVCVLHRHAHAGAQAPERAGRQLDIAAMRARDVACDRKAKAGADLVLVARLVEPEERTEHVLAPFRGNAGTVVIDMDGQEARVAQGFDRQPVAVALGVVDEIP